MAEPIKADVSTPIPSSRPLQSLINQDARAVVVREVGPERYVLNVGGHSIEAQVPGGLQPGESIQVRLEGSLQQLVLRVLTGQGGEASNAGGQPATVLTLPTLLDYLGLPQTAEHEQAVANAVRFRSPLVRENISQIVSAAHQAAEPSTASSASRPLDLAPRIEAASLLSAKELPVDADVVRSVATAIQNSGELATQLSNLSTELQRTAQSISAPTSGPESDAIGKVVQQLQSLATSMQDAVATELDGARTLPPQGSLHPAPAGVEFPGAQAATIALQSDPLLAALDSLIQQLNQLPILEVAAGTAPAASPEQILAQIQALITGATPETPADFSTVMETVRDIPPQQREAILQSVLRLESEAMDRNSLLSSVRSVASQVESVREQISGIRILNQVSLMQADHVFVAEVPGQVDGKPVTVLVRVQDREKRKRRPGDGLKGMNVLIRLAMSRIGEVESTIHMVEDDAPSIRIRVESDATRKLFEKHRVELEAVLKNAGFSPDVSIVKDGAPPTPLLDVFGADDEPYTGLDLKA